MKRVVALVVGAVLVLSACSGESGAKAKAKPSASKSTAPQKSTAKLSGPWGKKFDAVSNKGGPGVCADVGTDRCANFLTEIMTLTLDLQEEIDGQHRGREYPRTMDQIRKMTRASDGYVNAGCQGSAEARVDGSSCFSDASTIMVGAPIIGMNLGTDEIRYKLDG
ncbi:hypothetical protein ACGFWI_01215 [Streptomyces sp. NPDC048434]|uniref:hypothetical protein n=1 Tax=Streptomyces sp. NPDC048434 TaxID=3365549 RepID=UPI0037156038